MVKHAFRLRLMKENPLDFVEKKVKGKAKKKDVLTLAELQTLAATNTESKEVRRAFLLSCVTGLRWCDIVTLTWKSIDLNNKLINLRQSKTAEDLCTPLNDTAIALLGESGDEDDLVFILPTANGANKTVKAWVKRAGISKAITWHNARHSFGTNLIFNEVGLLTTSQLMGLTSVKHSQRYVNTAREMKEKATNLINFKV